ncbi:MAG: photosystem II protein Y [Thainema sp.]
MDWRVIVVFAPLLLALGWVAYNIGQAAIQQAKTFWDKEA